MKHSLYKAEGSGLGRDYDLIDESELKELASRTERPALSIVIPTSRQETQIPPVRLKSALDRVESLLDRNLRRPISKARELIDNAPFWAHQGESLLVLISHDHMRTFRLRISWPGLETIGERFYLLPLIHARRLQKPYFMLVISKKECGLYAGMERALRRMEKPYLPRRDEYLAFDESQVPSSLRTDGVPGFGRRGTIPFGHGTGRDQAFDKQQVNRYFREIGRRVDDALRNNRETLVVVGPEHLIPIYRSNSSHPFLKELAGDFQDKNLTEIGERIWPVVAHELLEQEQDAMARIRETPHRDLVIHELEELLPAAATGAVDSLFVASGARIFGRFDLQSEAVTLDHQGDELLSLAASEVYLHGGQVFWVEANNFPFAPPLAALLRYPLHVSASVEQAQSEGRPGA